MARLPCIFVVFSTATLAMAYGGVQSHAALQSRPVKDETVLLQTATQITRLAGPRVHKMTPNEARVGVHKMTPHEAGRTRLMLKTEKLQKSTIISLPTCDETSVISSPTLTVIAIFGIIAAVLVGIGTALQDFSIQDYSAYKKTGGPYDATRGTYMTAYVLALASLAMAIMAPEVKRSLPGEVHTNIIAAYFIGFLCWSSTGLMHHIWPTDGRGHNILSTCARTCGGWSAMSRAEAAMKVAVLSGKCQSCPDADTIGAMGSTISGVYLIAVLLAVFQYIPVTDVRLRRIMGGLMDITLLFVGYIAGQMLWASLVLVTIVGVLALAHTKMSPFIYSATFNETGLLHSASMFFLASTFGLLCAMTKCIS